MAFYECVDKVKPFITTETVFDNVITFNDIYGNIPLVTCDSLISGYQEGSGTPSPDNVRPLVSFSSATLTANSNTYTFTFGQSIYQGDIDWLKGVVRATHKYFIFDGSVDETWSIIGSGDARRFGYNTEVSMTDASTAITNYLSYLYGNRGSWGTFTIANNTYIICHDNQSNFTTLGDFTSYLSNNNLQLAAKLTTPIEIPLGGIQLLTNQGINTYSCNTGDTTVEYINIT